MRDLHLKQLFLDPPPISTFIGASFSPLRSVNSLSIKNFQWIKIIAFTDSFGFLQVFQIRFYRLFYYLFVSERFHCLCIPPPSLHLNLHQLFTDWRNTWLDFSPVEVKYSTYTAFSIPFSVKFSSHFFLIPKPQFLYCFFRALLVSYPPPERSLPSLDVMRFVLLLKGGSHIPTRFYT